MKMAYIFVHFRTGEEVVLTWLFLRTSLMVKLVTLSVYMQS